MERERLSQERGSPPVLRAPRDDRRVAVAKALAHTGIEVLSNDESTLSPREIHLTGVQDPVAPDQQRVDLSQQLPENPLSIRRPETEHFGPPG